MIFAIGLFPPLSASAEEAPPNLAAIRQLLDKGDTTQSIVVLERAMLRLAGNPEFDYLLGVALHRGGRSGEALFALERTLMAEPARADVRLMIAEISVERGATAYAQEVLAPLSPDTLNREQRDRLEKIRARLDEKSAPRLSIRGYFAVGLGRDSNVTGGPNLKQVVMPGSEQNRALAPGAPLIATVLGTAEQAADRVGVAEAGVSLVQALDEGLWLVASGSYNMGFGDKRNDVEEGYTSADLGVVKRIGQDSVSATLLAQEYRVAQSVYRESLGYRLNWRRTVTDTARVGAYVQQLSYGYPARVNNILNATRTVTGLNGDVSFGDGLLQYGVYGGDEIAKDPTKAHFSYRLLGAHLGASWKLNDDLRIAAGAIHEDRRHSARDALFLLYRNDAQRTLGLSVDYKLTPSLHFVPQYTFTSNDSTAPLYAYARRALMFQLRWNFDNEKN